MRDAFYFTSNGLPGALFIDETVRVIIQMYTEELISIWATIKATSPLSRWSRSQARALPQTTHKHKNKTNFEMFISTSRGRRVIKPWTY